MSLFHSASHDQDTDAPSRPGTPGRSVLLGLSLTVIMALGGILAGPVAATSQTAQPDPTGDPSVDIPVEADVRLELTPVDGTAIWLGDSRTYTATAIVTVGPDPGGGTSPDTVTSRLDVTRLTRFRVSQEGRRSGRCRGADCTPDAVGVHTITGEFPRWPGNLIEGSTTLEVRQPVELLRLLPGTATISAGDSKRYTAIGLTSDEKRLGDVTAETRFTFTKQGRRPVNCRRADCAPREAGQYTITGTLDQEGLDPVTGTASLTVVPSEPTSLRLEPASETVDVDIEQDFRAVGADRFGNEENLTEQTDFTIDRTGSTSTEGGSCATAGDEVRCKAGTPGIYRVTGTLDDRRLSATATLTVLTEPIEPSLQEVDPGASSPGRDVRVKGTTGSCNRVGTLIQKKLGLQMRVEDEFETRFRVPSGTPPGPYELLLDVTCDDNETKRATHPFEVRNQPPEAVDDPDATTIPDQKVPIAVIDNDNDPDDPDGYRTSLEAGTPEHGTVEVQPDMQIVYTPDTGFADVDQFRYALCDIVDARGTKQCGTATVTVTVNQPDPEPVDDPDEATLRDQPVVIDVMGNDRHPNGSRLRVLRPERPGSRAEKQADGTVRYTPEPGYVGEDTFRYRYCAGTAACPSATVTVDVTEDKPPPPEPEPVDDPDEVTPQDKRVVIDVSGNDRHPDLARLRVKDQPADGQAERLPDGTVRYSPDPGFTGTNRFTYDYCGEVPGVRRRTACPSATVTVDVTEDKPPPPEPEPVDDPDETTLRDRPVVVDVMGNDRNPDAARLRVKDQPADGQAERLPDGTVRYSPDPGFTGTGTFSYDYCGSVADADRKAACPSATVTVTVTSTPVITSIRPGSTSPGTPVEVAGNTGSCNRAGTLTLEGTGVVVHITADQRTQLHRGAHRSQGRRPEGVHAGAQRRLPGPDPAGRGTCQRDQRGAGGGRRRRHHYPQPRRPGPGHQERPGP